MRIPLRLPIISAVLALGLLFSGTVPANACWHGHRRCVVVYRDPGCSGCYAASYNPGTYPTGFPYYSEYYPGYYPCYHGFYWPGFSLGGFRVYHW